VLCVEMCSKQLHPVADVPLQSDKGDSVAVFSEHQGMCREQGDQELIA
jgi:hypothetical protein